MSEPVAWRVETNSGWYLFDDIYEARLNCGPDDEPEPLYTQLDIDEIKLGRDAAIAELVDLLKYVQSRVFGTLILPEIGKAITKYDKKGAV